MKRKIIRIDEEKCDGCGLCIPNCPEGALKIIDGKARLVGEIMCDGLGACMGRCPVGAIEIEEREAEAYDERAVMAHIARIGPTAVKDHLTHLKEHGKYAVMAQGLSYLKETQRATTPASKDLRPADFGLPRIGGCPGSRAMSFAPVPALETIARKASNTSRASALRHWPVQLHLISPRAAHYQGSDLLLAADCVPFAMANFHEDFLSGKTLAIACPKLDEGQESYREKLTALVDEAQINSLTVITMQVPCCSGLVRLAQTAVAAAQRQIPIKSVVISLQGDVLEVLPA
jgi:NAD-dependent dihydropyrimidine dehydrogenase PreA subunit